MPRPRINLVETARLGALAGVAGGLAEVLWISSYAAAGGIDAAEVARSITAVTRLPIQAASVEAGLAIHMALAVALGVTLAFAWKALRVCLSRDPGVASHYGILVGALAVVWMVNFLIVLPWIGPAFVHVVPYHLSFVSKLSFGVAAAMALRFPLRRGTAEIRA